MIGETEKAINDFQDALRINPRNPIAHANRGAIYLKRKELDKALADCDEAIALDPRCAHAYGNRGQIYINRREYGKGGLDYKKAIELDPNSVETLCGVSRFLSCHDLDLARDGKLALEYAVRACELTKWKDSYCLEALAAAYAETGQFEEAVRWQEKAEKLFDEKDERITKDKLEAHLKLYQAKKPRRGPE
jgi:tetratricopeptide (TPR) repeat protein